MDHCTKDDGIEVMTYMHKVYLRVGKKIEEPTRLTSVRKMYDNGKLDVFPSQQNMARIGDEQRRQLTDMNHFLQAQRMELNLHQPNKSHQVHSRLNPWKLPL